MHRTLIAIIALFTLNFTLNEASAGKHGRRSLGSATGGTAHGQPSHSTDRKRNPSLQGTSRHAAAAARHHVKQVQFHQFPYRVVWYQGQYWVSYGGQWTPYLLLVQRNSSISQWHQANFRRYEHPNF